MERLPLLIALGALLIWILAALFLNKKLRTAARGVGLGLSLVQLGAATWAAARIFSDTGAVQYHGVWFSVGPNDVFEVDFLANHLGVVLWLSLSLFLAVIAYFALLGQIKGTRTQLRGEAVSVPILALGALCTIMAANFISYYFGWALTSAAAFLAVAFSAPNRDDRASASARYFILSLIPEIFFLAGVLGCHVFFQTLSFSGINEKAGAEMPFWPMMCLIIGMMLRNLQIPLMQCARYLASARAAATPVYFLAHAITASALFSKIYPAIAATDGIQYFAIIPALTAIAAAALALPEEEPTLVIGWVVSYICAAVFLSGLAGHYQAAQALAITGSIGAFLLANTLLELTDQDGAMRWYAGFGMLVLTGLPLTGWGWARYLEYVGLYHNEGQVPPFHWILLGLKILADLLMGIALWGVVRERWMKARETAAKPKWQVIVPLTIVALACLAIAAGGRPFSGLAGQAGFDFIPGAVWFEKLVTPPVSAAVKLAPNATELVGTDADIFARLLTVGMFLVPALLAGLWIFRDKKALEEFRGFCRRAVQKLGQQPEQEPKLWSWIALPLTDRLGRVAALFDSRVIDYVMADMWATPARLVRNAFSVFESKVIDRNLVDGIAEAVATIGKSLRLVQNGQVQFYFALGLILMGAVVVKFVVVGG